MLVIAFEKESESMRASETNACAGRQPRTPKSGLTSKVAGLAGSGGTMREWCRIGVDLKTDAGDN